MVQHNHLVRMPVQDIEQNYKKQQKKEKKRLAKKEEFKQEGLRILPNTEQIHNRLFTQQIGGDGHKEPNQYQQASHQKPVVVIPQVKSRKARLKNKLDNIIEESEDQEDFESYEKSAFDDTARRPILLAPPTPQNKKTKKSLVDEVLRGQKKPEEVIDEYALPEINETE